MPEEDVFKHMQKIRKELDEAFESFWEKPRMPALPTMKHELAGFKEPLTEISVKRGSVLAKFKMPGMVMKDVAVNVHPDFVELKAQKKEESKEEEKGFFKQEKSFHRFYRKLPLPMPVNPKLAEPHFSNGILEITMPKAEVKRIAKK
ncbi:MAG TPA: Hsp20/alpha crystallin family protein [Nanoarchaeota archaeon]|nr:Hsp20/alpha crystallin family protein [Nanoarchaeota archaeon]